MPPRNFWIWIGLGVSLMSVPFLVMGQAIFVRGIREDYLEGLHPAVRDRGGRLEVYGTCRKDSGAAEGFHDAPLGHHVFAAVLGRQLLPESEAAGFLQRLAAEHGAAAQPCDLVGQPLPGLEAQV